MFQWWLNWCRKIPQWFEVPYCGCHCRIGPSRRLTTTARLVDRQATGDSFTSPPPHRDARMQGIRALGWGVTTLFNLRDVAGGSPGDPGYARGVYRSL